MGFLGRWPDGFVPEEHGWVRGASNGGKIWIRWEVPFRFPATLGECLHDAATGAVGGWYIGPVEGMFPEQVRVGDAWAEMLRDDLNDFNQERVS